MNTTLSKPVELDKRFVYRVVKSSYPQVKPGALHLYTRGKGPTHFEMIHNTKTFKLVGSFSMEKIGVVWIVGGKWQAEKPPAKRGAMTRRMVERVEALNKRDGFGGRK